MTESLEAEVTAADAVRWLHEEGLIRLASVGGRIPDPIVAYTIDIGTGTVSAHPATGVGLGSDVVTLSADDLPGPIGTPKRLVVVGITSADAVLVVDLAVADRISINGERPETAARAWVMQLLLNSEVTITTNSADLAIAESPRCRHGFIPGAGATIVTIDDKRPPVTTVTVDSSNDGPDHLDIATGGVGEMYLGARFWQLRQIMRVEDGAWEALAQRLAAEDDPNPNPETETS
ncbi:hypothetical protein [Nocardia alni]|uniref:hypothetical protein n=1 Tax=Nocardia alni TaxID=2815723 RepID=UPI0020B32305|nr:hypothetical protein [Nocardia alni]